MLGGDVSLSERRWTAAAGLGGALLFALGLAAAVGQLAASARIAIYDGCGWDGYFYCAMARGEVATEPFSRRILVPFLTKQVETDGLAGFWLVDILSLSAATGLAMYLVWRLRTANDHSELRSLTLAASLLIGAAFLLARNSFHFVATYPAQSDALALLLLMCVASLVALPLLPSTRLLLAPICFLAPVTREQLSAVLVLALVLATALRLITWRIALVGAAGAVAGGLYAFSRPHTGVGQSLVHTLRVWLEQDFGSWDGFFRFATMVFLALGPFLLLVVQIQRRPFRTRSTLWLTGVAAIFVAVSIFNGGDTDRILFPAGLLIAVAAAVSVRGAKGLTGLAVIVGAYGVQQQPWHAVSGDPTSWLTFFGLRLTTTDAVVHHALVPSLVALPIAILGLLLVRSARNDLRRSIG